LHARDKDAKFVPVGCVNMRRVEVYVNQPVT
jgi:hypothetical protein